MRIHLVPNGILRLITHELKRCRRWNSVPKNARRTPTFGPRLGFSRGRERPEGGAKGTRLTFNTGSGRSFSAHFVIRMTAYLTARLTVEIETLVVGAVLWQASGLGRSPRPQHVGCLPPVLGRVLRPEPRALAHTRRATRRTSGRGRQPGMPCMRAWGSDARQPKHGIQTPAELLRRLHWTLSQMTMPVRDLVRQVVQSPDRTMGIKRP